MLKFAPVFGPSESIQATMRAVTLVLAITMAFLVSMPAWSQCSAGTGTNSLRCGNGSTAPGQDGSAYGHDSVSAGSYSTALGSLAETSGYGGVAVGGNARAAGYGTALGAGAEAPMEYSVAVGYIPDATGLRSTAVGAYSRATAGDTVALGYGADVSAEKSIAIGAAAFVDGPFSVAMGYQAAVSTGSSAIGYSAEALGDYSTAVGNGGDADGDYSTALGNSTLSSGYISTALGYNATASGDSALAIGRSAEASGASAVAIGRYAVATNPYTIVLGSIPGIGLGTNYADVAIGTTAPLAPLHVARDDGAAGILVQENAPNPAGRTLFTLANRGNTKFEIKEVNSGTRWQFTNNGDAFRISKFGTGQVEFQVFNNGDAVLLGDLAIGGSFTEMSDRNQKHAIVPLDGTAVLEKLADVPVSEWSYKTDSADQRHIGPMAQDFYAAFGLASGETRISARDMAGVNMAAVKALQTQLSVLTAELDEERARNRELATENQDLAQRLSLVERWVASQGVTDNETLATR